MPLFEMYWPLRLSGTFRGGIVLCPLPLVNLSIGIRRVRALSRGTLDSRGRCGCGRTTSGSASN